MDTRDEQRAPADGRDTDGRAVIDVRGIPPIDRDEMVVLATAEYHRILDLLRGLEDADWHRPTACDGWTVQHMVAHLLGAAEANASVPETVRQLARGRRRVRGTDAPLIDGINAVQLDDRVDLGPEALIRRLAAVAPAAVRGRRRTPPPLRRVKVPGPSGIRITMGHLVDVIYTRDEWMHRIDIARATGRAPVLTPGHDGRIVADVVRDWAQAHDQPVTLELTGPAGGRYQQHGGGDTSLTLDAVELCLAVSGREPGEGLLGVEVVF
jgi:uncharacterized protein (TIGR03083 family)